MTTDQEHDLFIEWSLYELKEQKRIIDEYLSISAGTCSWNGFLNFLKEKLQIGVPAYNPYMFFRCPATSTNRAE